MGTVRADWRSTSRKVSEGEMNRNGGIGIIGVIVIVLVVLWLLGVIHVGR